MAQRAALRAPRESVRVPFEIQSAAPAGALAGLGDRLLVSKDDGFDTLPFDYEGRLTVSPGAAGSDDYLAFRFSSQEFAHTLPVRIRGVSIGLDNRYGRTSWPLIGIAKENPSSPLALAPALLSSVSDFALPATALPAPAGAKPDAFQRFLVALPSNVDVMPELVVDDGMWSDAFQRPFPEMLDNPSSDWLECSLSQCGGPRSLLADGAGVTKLLSGTAIGVKFPAASVLARRPVTDLDLALSVRYDVTDPLAGRAGLVFRLQNLQEFYVVEYQKSTSQVRLLAQTPGGISAPLASAPAPPGANQGTLGVSVRGVHPATRIDVSFNGAPLFSHTDTLYTYGGVLSGIISLGTTAEDAFDDFSVRRDPDYFAVVKLPVGEDAGLPADYSSQSVGFSNVLASTDGASYSSLPLERGCLKLANSFVGLELEDTTNPDDNLFQVETKLTELAVACPSCPVRLNPCSASQGTKDKLEPVFETGQTLEVRAGFWNERVPDLSRVILRAQIYEAGCPPLASDLPVASRDTLPFASPGQSSAGPVFARSQNPLLSYAPVTPTTHCVELVELYDSNGDGCPDGFEDPAACGASCTCIKDPDENASTGILRREIQVESPCTPLLVSEIVPGSLRVVKDATLSTDSTLRWSSTSTRIRQYNVHVTELKPEVSDVVLRSVAPLTTVMGAVPPLDTTRTLTLPDPARALFVRVFQNDGCPSASSLPDP